MELQQVSRTSQYTKPGQASSSRRPLPEGSEHNRQLLQRTMGNRALGLLLQTKLTVGPAGDRYEQEADRVADQVMRMVAPAPDAAPSVSAPAAPAVQRKCACGGSCDDCQKEQSGQERGSVQRKPGNGIGSQTAEAPPIVHEVLRTPGQPLDSATRAFMEPRFGRDFSNVRIHAGPTEQQSAREVSAQAYTVGNHIVFDTGGYSPATPEGQRLLAHELTHVVQQSTSATTHPSSNSSLRQGQTVHHSAAQGLQRQPARPSGRSPAPATASRAGVVEDGQRAASGQMQRTPFLDSLQARLLKDCSAELAVVGATAHDCPYILKSIQYYRKRPLSELLRLIHHFAHPPAGANASGLINAVATRARALARNLARGGAASQGTERIHPMAERGDGRIGAHNPLAVRSQLGSGNVFEGPTRSQMEQAFGVNFGSVRIHTDSAAAGLSRDLGARAFTVGRHIAFAPGQYQPGTLSGDSLLAHELAHTLQQGSGTEAAADASRDLELEHQADRTAIAALGGRVLPGFLPGLADGLRIQRGPAILAGALLVGEVGADVAVADGVVIVTTEVAAPAVIEAVVAPAVVDTLAPVATEALATTAVDTLATTSTASWAAPALVGTAVAATTLSSDSGPVSRPDSDTDEEEQQRKCRGMAVGQRGGNTCHDQFAAMISGVNREFGLETPEGLYVEFDALGMDRVLYEIKTGYGYLLNNSPATLLLREQTIHRFIDQALAQTAVATRCGYPLVWVFNNPAVANFVNGFIPPHVTSIPFPCDIDR